MKRRPKMLSDGRTPDLPFDEIALFHPLSTGQMETFGIKPDANGADIASVYKTKKPTMDREVKKNFLASYVQSGMRIGNVSSRAAIISAWQNEPNMYAGALNLKVS